MLLGLESKTYIINPSTVAGYYIHFDDMTLPMVTCPLCCRPGFSTSDSLCSALVDVTTRKLCCPICNHVVVGLDKFTIHMFSHSLNKFGLESGKETAEICEAEGSHSRNVNIKTNASNNSGDYNNCILKLQNSSSYKNGADEIINKSTDKPPEWRMNSSLADVQKTFNIPDSSLICFRADNGQIFALSPEYLGSSLKNVTINTQNYITNTNITTSTVQTSVVEKVQKRKYSQVFENENSESINKNNEDNSPDNYSNAESVNSWPSTPSVLSDADKPSNSSNSIEREFESCKDLLTKGDFSTLTDEIGELHIKKEFSLTDSMVSDEIIDDSEDRKDDDRKKESLNCELCPFVFPNKTILAMHKQLIHKKVEVEIESKRKLLICNLCPRTFSLRSSLMIHRKVAHAGGFGNSESGASSKQPVPKPACQICGKFFKKEIHLAQHMKAHDEKQWQCTICSKTFTTKYFLKKHRRLHTGETPYKCNKCGKAFTFQQSYHKHLLYHNDEKPYCCAQCGRLFKELSTLHNHERIHSGEKPFSCETCGKAFRQRVSYLVHRRIHTGAMPYKCTACNKSFRYKISQRTHKCLAQPPGVVVRTSGSLVERLQAAMTKAAEEIEQKPSLEKTPSQKRESPVIDGIRKPSLSNQSISETAYSDNRPSASYLSPPSTNTEKQSLENQIVKSPEFDRIQIDKPQIYLLVKGPNEETYYQPLIISQTIGINSDQKNPSTSHMVGTSTQCQRNAKDSSSGNINKSSRTLNKEPNKKSIHENVASSKNTKKVVQQTNKVQSPMEPPKPKPLEKVVDKVIPRNDEHISDDSLMHIKKGVKLEEEVKGPSLHTKSSEISMDEILRNLNCDELVESQSNQQNNDISLTNHKLEGNSDMAMMGPTDMFSFVLSPSLSSPSDRLGKLSLSSNSAHQQLGIDSFDTPGVFSGNMLSSSESHQESFFDTISDDALKEFLFGTSS